MGLIDYKLGQLHNPALHNTNIHYNRVNEHRDVSMRAKVIMLQSLKNVHEFPRLSLFRFSPDL